MKNESNKNKFILKRQEWLERLEKLLDGQNVLVIPENANIFYSDKDIISLVIKYSNSSKKEPYSYIIKKRDGNCYIVPTSSMTLEALAYQVKSIERCFVQNFEERYNEIRNLRQIIRNTCFSHDDKCEDFIRDIVQSFGGCVDFWEELGFYVTIQEFSIEKVYINENGSLLFALTGGGEITFPIFTTNSLFELSSKLYGMLEKKQKQN